MNATKKKIHVIETQKEEGAYGFDQTAAVIDHPKHGRLLLVEGYGGENTIHGGTYRWRHGVACSLLEGDTLAGLDATRWNDCISLYSAVCEGVDSSRPSMGWDGKTIDKVARSAGL